MATYAALLTLMDTIHKIQNHPLLPVSLDKNQVESLIDNLTFLQKFLEDHSPGHNRNDEAAYDLESRIADAARTAEDELESHLVDQVLASSSGENKLYECLEKCHECLYKVVDDLDLIRMEIMDDMIKGTTINPVQIHPRPMVPSRWDLQTLSFKGLDSVVGLDVLLLEMMDRLTGQESSRQIILIAGMGGIGKTTLARIVYSNALIQQHFDVRAWTTISQEYDIHQILVEIVSQIKTEGRKGDLCEMSEYDKVPNPIYCHGNDIVTGKLQASSFKCSEEIFKRIQNIKKLRTEWDTYYGNWRELSSFANNIGRLYKLESYHVLSFMLKPRGMYQNLTFLNSLKKLTIECFDADDELLGRIGSLPSLVKLKLRQGCFDGKEWATVEGHFQSLRFLLINDCSSLERWKTESTHFPCLEHLTLQSLRNLEEIPSDIGEIPTLVTIDVVWCGDSVADSAIKIQEEQEEQGNEDLQVRVRQRRRVRAFENVSNDLSS